MSKKVLGFIFIMAVIFYTLSTTRSVKRFGFHTSHYPARVKSFNQLLSTGKTS